MNYHELMFHAVYLTQTIFDCPVIIK